MDSTDGLKPTNPKDAIGSQKLPTHLWPALATHYGCLAMLDGALKYGRSNWRPGGVRASIYVDAIDRHMKAWFEGEDIDPDSGVPHLGHALACVAILVDAKEAGILTDDRQYATGTYRATVDRLTALVPVIQEHHASRNPKHYTKEDSDAAAVDVE